jgi:hypothetical protein
MKQSNRTKIKLLSLTILLVLTLAPFSFFTKYSSGELQEEPSSFEITSKLYQRLNYSTFFGGNAFDSSESIGFASDGSYYVAGSTYSSDFPVLNAYDSDYNGNWDVFVAKFSAENELLWSTYLGGTLEDRAYGLAVGGDDSCYITGHTYSLLDFPIENGYNDTFGGQQDAFVAKFSSGGSLLWSTFLGGSSYDYGYGIAVGDDGSCYVIGETYSPDLPVSITAYDKLFNGSSDAFIAKYSSDGSTLSWCTYLGGNNDERGYDIALGNLDSCFVVGETTSDDFPVINAYDNTFGDSQDVFLAEFSSAGILQWSSYMGGNQSDSGRGIALSSDNNYFYVTGFTYSNDFPIVNAHNDTKGAYDDAFVAKFMTTGPPPTLLWSTYLGGNDYESGLKIALDSDNSCYVTGHTHSDNFEMLNAFDATQNGSTDGFVAKFNGTGSLSWSTYLGGTNAEQGKDVAVDNNANLLVTGYTGSSDFPITDDAYDDLISNIDVFIANITSLEDIAGPKIQSVETIPENPSDLDEVTIQCTVTDELSEIENASVIFRVNSGSWTKTNMTNIIGSVYQKNIGMFNAGDEVNYYFTAVDTVGNNALNDNDSNYFSFIVSASDSTPPVISNIALIPGSPTINDTLTIRCEATDDSNIHNVTLYYRINGGTWQEAEMTIYDINAYRVILDLPFSEDDLFEYYIEAVDNSANYNVAIDDNGGEYYSVVIQGASSTGSPTPTPGLTAYGLLAFLLFMPVITVVIRKRSK